ncbi:MAG: hypothetical protein GY863_24295 [bacterium]|nr:hypothetical protein [bacterium]
MSGDVLNCRYSDCYYNNNTENTCVEDTVTVSATGICENLTHCDDYVCSDCEMFEICGKAKKNSYLNDK